MVFPDGLEAIGNYAFWNCYKLGEVLIPASVSDIGVEVFTACGMDTIRVEEGSRFYKDLDGILFNADGTELLEFPPRRGGCCYIPDGVKTIGESAFLYCDQLAGVTIPASVTRIEPKSFEYCSNLTDVYYGGTAEQWDRIEIGDANSFLQNAELHPSWKVTPGLVWRYANSNYDPEIDEMQYSEKADSPTRSPYRVKVRSGMSVQFLWMDENGNTEPVNAADLRFSANLGLSRANGSFGILFGNSAGEGYIEYNGSRIDAVVELNELDFYRSPEAAGGNLLYGWNYSGSNNDTVYLVSRMEGSISKVEYEGEGEFECLISHDGKYAAIKPITVPPLSGTNLEFLVTVAGPQGESSRSVSIWFENNRKCGDDLTWTLDEDGVLTISGTGDMWDYQWNSQPWADCKNNIRTVTVASGVTGIGNYAFCDCSGLTEVTLPESLREIRNSAFENCTALTDVYYGGSLLDWNFVSVSDGNEALLNAVLHPGKAITPGLVWRYADVDTDPETYEFQFSEKPDSPTRSPYQATINRFDSLQFLWVDEDGHTEPVNAAELRFTNLIPGMVVGSFVMLHGDTVGEGYIEYNGSRINTSVRFRDLEFYRTPKATEAGILSMWHYSSAMDTAYLVSTMEGRIRSVTYEGEGAFTCTISDDGTYVTVKPEDPPTQPDTALYFLVTMDTPDGPYSLKVGLWFNDKRNCGDDLTWTLDEDGVLTISGTGDMWDYPHPPEQPWFAFANEIQEVVLKPGVTGIGDHAFHNCREIRTVTMPEGVTSIGDLAFSGCDALTDAYYSGTAEQWAQVTVGMGNDPLASAVRFNAVTGTLDEDGAALSWAFAPEDGRLSVTGDIPSGEAVYAAVFGEGGRFLKVIPFTGAGGTADTGTDYGQIKLILADAQAAPRCAFASIVRD